MSLLVTQKGCVWLCGRYVAMSVKFPSQTSLDYCAVHALDWKKHCRFKTMQEKFLIIRTAYGSLPTGHLLAYNTRDHGILVPGTTFFSHYREDFLIFSEGIPRVLCLYWTISLWLAGLYTWTAMVFEGICRNWGSKQELSFLAPPSQERCQIISYAEWQVWLAGQALPVGLFILLLSPGMSSCINTKLNVQ